MSSKISYYMVCLQYPMKYQNKADKSIRNKPIQLSLTTSYYMALHVNTEWLE